MVSLSLTSRVAGFIDGIVEFTMVVFDCADEVHAYLVRIVVPLVCDTLGVVGVALGGRGGLSQCQYRTRWWYKWLRCRCNTRRKFVQVVAIKIVLSDL